VSESAPESGGGGGGGNVFTRKVGPLPMWGWMGIALLLAIGYYLIKKNKSNANAAPATNNSPGGVDSSLVPQFVNQVYNQETPPPAPNVTVNNTVPTQPAPPPDNDHEHDDGGNGNTPPPAHGPGGSTHPGPKPAGPPRKVSYTRVTVQPGQTLQSLAAQYHTTVDAIADAPGNVYVKGEVPGDKKVGQQLGTGAGLKTGMKINIPVVH
jgi:LysM repeat protein